MVQVGCTQVGCSVGKEIYTILRPLALGCVNPVPTSTTFYNLLYNYVLNFFSIKLCVKLSTDYCLDTVSTVQMQRQAYERQP